MERAIIHVDMDAFYASVEQRDEPRLRGLPVIVGGHPRRGVVLAASYEVRPFGVRSAMPMARAVQLAPHAVVVPPRPEAYAEASEKIHAIFESVTPLIEPLSLDEAFLDVTASVKLLGAPAQIARRIRERIADELQLPSSAGIASVKFVAKIASDLAKPNGQREVPASETRAFLAPLPISRLWGVGPKTEQQLLRYGLKTIGDVAKREPAWLEQYLGRSGHHFWALSQGIDDRAVIPDRDAKSIGAEDTFDDDIDDLDALHVHLHSQALRVARRMRRAHVKGRVVVLKLKYADFRLRTRRTTLPSPTDDGLSVFRAASALLAQTPLEDRVRLTGVSVHDLGEADAQLALFDRGANRAQKLNTALDRIAERFGTRAVMPADVVAGERAVDDDWDEARRRMGASRFDAKKPR
jgi:DNA polymerase-4